MTEVSIFERDVSRMKLNISHGAGLAIVASLFAGCSGAGSVPQQSIAAVPASQSASITQPALNAHMYPLGAYGADIDIDSLRASKQTGSRPYKVKAGSK